MDQEFLFDSKPQLALGQIVVMLSRSQTEEMIYIGGTAKFAITRIWTILRKLTQCPPYIEAVLNNLSVEGYGVVVENTNGAGDRLARDVSF